MAGSGRISETGMASLVIVCALCSACLAGPVATFEFKDGAKQLLELVDFGEGRFALAELESADTREVQESEIRSIDFGKVPIELGPEGAIILPDGDQAMACFRWAAENRLFTILWRTCWLETALQGRERVEAFERALQRELAARPEKDKERDLRLAQVVVIYALGDKPAARERLIDLRDDPKYVDDPVIGDFIDAAKQRAAARGEAGERTRPE